MGAWPNTLFEGRPSTADQSVSGGPDLNLHKHNLSSSLCLGRATSGDTGASKTLRTVSPSVNHTTIQPFTSGTPSRFVSWKRKWLTSIQEDANVCLYCLAAEQQCAVQKEREDLERATCTGQGHVVVGLRRAGHHAEMVLYGANTIWYVCAFFFVCVYVSMCGRVIAC